jgi:hypothetical protein
LIIDARGFEADNLFGFPYKRIRVNKGRHQKKKRKIQINPISIKWTLKTMMRVLLVRLLQKAKEKRLQRPPLVAVKRL